MKKNRYKKKKSENITTKNELYEEDTQDINQLNRNNKFLKHTISTQRNQIKNLFHEIKHIQEKEDEHQERTKAFDKLDRYVKKMTENNRKVKTLW